MRKHASKILLFVALSRFLSFLKLCIENKERTK